jgi:hypothetical protein
VRDVHGRDVLLAADAVWSMRSLRESKLPSQITRPIVGDWRAYMKTIDLLHELCSKYPELTILPSHCEPTLAAYDGSWRAQ